MYNIQIYSGNLIWYKNRKEEKYKINVENMEKIFNKYLSYKKICLLKNNKIYWKLFKYSVTKYYLWLYDIWLYIDKEPDLREVYTWRISSIYDVYIQFNKYGFDIEFWMYSKFYIYFWKLCMIRNNVILNLKMKEKNKTYILFWNHIIRIIIVNYLDVLFFKFYHSFLLNT